MSFITQDKDLIKALLKIANNKYAQAGTPSPDPNLNTEILTTLVNKLRNNLNNHTEGDFVSLRDNSELNLANLQSDYQLLLFLQSNGIMYNGQPLAVAHSPGLPEDRQGEQHYNKIQGLDKKLYVKYPKPKDGRGDDFRFWINKNGILEFLRSLYDRTKDTSSGGNLLKVLLDKLVIAINRNSGEKIDPASKPAPKLPPEFPFDQFPQPYLLSRPFENRGPQVLTIKDISSADDFYSWLSKLKVNDKNNQEIQAPAIKNNICLSLNAILDRAENYVQQTRTDPDAQKKQTYEYYYNQILSFVNANNCNVNTNVPATTEKPGGTGTDGDKESGDRRRTQTVLPEQNLDMLIRKLPLNMSTISFPHIEDFFKYLNDFASPIHKERYQRFAMTVSSYINQYQRLLKSVNTESFNLNSSAREFQSMLREASNYAGALEYLSMIVATTRNAIADLKVNLGDGIADQYKSYLASQVGHSGTSGSSIASQNLEVLSRLESEVSNVIQRTKGR